MKNNSIPFMGLQREYKEIKSPIDKALKHVVDNQIFILGPALEKFEREFADFLQAKYVSGVGSGTDALIIALQALGITKGDEVITPTNSFIATTIAIIEVGATPIFVDSDPKTFQIDITQIEKKITKKTKLILPVHLYGTPCDIEAIMRIAKKYKLFVVEDACQAHGASLKGKKVGTFGDIGVFSFYPSKNLGAYGDGGALCTDSKNLHEKIQLLRNYGQKKKYFHSSVGRNSRLDDMQAAILSAKLPFLEKWNKKRRALALSYTALLESVTVPLVYKDSFPVYHLFPILAEKRDALMKYLKEQGIQTLIHYPVPIHLQECYAHLGYKKGDFPVAEYIANHELSLPMYPQLQEKEWKYIAEQVNQFSKKSPLPKKQ